MKKNKFIAHILIILFLQINANAKQSEETGSRYIDLRIGECSVKLIPTFNIGVSNDDHMVLYDFPSSEVMSIAWKKDTDIAFEKDIFKKKLRFEKNGHMYIVDIKNSDSKKIVGKNFYIIIDSKSKILKSIIDSCNQSWNEKFVKIDIETLIDKFNIDENEIRILEIINNKIGVLH